MAKENSVLLDIADWRDLKSALEKASSANPLVLENESTNLPLLQNFFKNSPFKELSFYQVDQEYPDSGLANAYLKSDPKNESPLTIEFLFYATDETLLGFGFTLHEVPIESGPLLTSENAKLVQSVQDVLDASKNGSNKCSIVYSSFDEKSLSIRFGCKYWGFDFFGEFPLASSQKDDVFLETNFEEVSLNDLAKELTSLFPKDLFASIPKSNHETLKFSGARVCLSPTDKTMQFVTLCFDLEIECQIGNLQFTNVQAQFVIGLGGKGSPVFLGGIISTSIQLGSDEDPLLIHCSGELLSDGFAIEGGLSGSIPLEKVKLISQIPFGSAEITNIEFRLENSSGLWDGNFLLECKNLVEYKGIQLSDIVFLASFSYDQAFSVQGGVEGTFDLGGTQVFLSAISEGEGWIFKGGLSKIELASLQTYFQKKNITLPTLFNDVSLCDLFLTVDSKNNRYEFSVGSKINLNDSNSISLRLGIEHDASNTHFSLEIGNLLFDLVVDGEELRAEITSDISLGEILNLFQIGEIQNLKNVLGIKLDRISFRYLSQKKQFTFLLDGKSHVASIVISHAGFFVGIRVNSFALTNLPVVGKLPESLSVELSNIQVLFSKGIQISDGDEKYPWPRKEGFDISSDLKLGSEVLPIAQEREGGDVQVESSSDQGEKELVNWVSLQKSLGPIQIDKVGLQFSNGHLGVLFGISFIANGLKLTLIGMKFETSFQEFKPEFSFEGVDVDFHQGNIGISGGLVKSGKDLIGDFVIKSPAFSLYGMGGYELIAEQPSLFVFAYLNYPIGGAPAFFIQGLAAGFGYNRDLKIPSVEKVSDFPFIKWVMGKEAPSKTDKPGVILDRLTKDKIVSAAAGQQWLAAGVKFSTFELINSFALGIVKFGTRLEFDLLGFSIAKLPDKKHPFVVAELQIKATCIPDQGFFGIKGSLTRNSYLFDKNCHLSGGFAYYFWFSGPHAGDFVLTMGGYGSKYKPPANYPKVKPIGIKWKIDSHLSVKGEMYFALTSKAIMAGGKLSAVWKSGGIRAWFDFQADFLMFFDPFQYFLKGHVSLGVSFEVKLLVTKAKMSAHLGVALEIQGPNFSLRAVVHLAIISFTISVDKKKKPKPLSWGQFTDRYLPKKEAVLEFNVISGLKKKIEDGIANCDTYIVNTENFEGMILSSIPVKTYKLSAGGEKKGADSISVGPSKMGADSFSSHLELKGMDDFDVSEERKSVPKSLWGVQKENFPKGNPTSETVIPKVLCGFRLAPKKGTEGKSLPSINMNTLLIAHDTPLEYNLRSPQFSTSPNAETSVVVNPDEAKKALEKILPTLLPILGMKSLDIHLDEVKEKGYFYQPLESKILAQKDSI